MSLAIASETYFFSSVQFSHLNSLAGESKNIKAAFDCSPSTIPGPVLPDLGST